MRERTAVGRQRALDVAGELKSGNQMVKMVGNELQKWETNAKIGNQMPKSGSENPNPNFGNGV